MLHEKLRAIRKQKNISLETVAREVGFSKGYLSCIERGKYELTNNILIAYERVLGLDEGTFVNSNTSLKYCFSDLYESLKEGFRMRMVKQSEVFSDLDSIRVPDEMMIMSDGVAELIIKLINDVSEEEPELGEAIFITTFHVGNFLRTQEQKDDWHVVLRKALRKNWDIEHIFKLQTKIDEKLDWSIIKNLVSLSNDKGGNYLTYYVPSSKVFSQDMILIPRKGCFLFLSSLNDSYSCIFFPFHMSVYTDAFKNHFFALREESEKLARIVGDNFNFMYDLVDVETKSGDEYLFSDIWSSKLVPETVFEKLIVRKLKGNEKKFQFHSVKAKHSERVQAFKDRLKKNQVVHIINKRAVELLINGSYEKIQRLAEGKYEGKEPEVCLSHIINLLEVNDNFNLYLNHSKLDEEFQVFFETVEGTNKDDELQALILELWGINCHNEQECVNLVIYDPVAIEVFISEFKHKINCLKVEKSTTINSLKGMIKA